VVQGCQICLGTIYQNGKNIPKWPQIIPKGHAGIIQYAKWQYNRPNGHKIYQHLSLQDTQNFTQIVIFGLKIYIPSGSPGWPHSRWHNCNLPRVGKTISGGLRRNASGDVGADKIVSFAIQHSGKIIKNYNFAKSITKDYKKQKCLFSSKQNGDVLPEDLECLVFLSLLV
jgi:hypothetical protein